MPALLVNFPNTALPTLMGTNKISGFSGTFVSAIQYGKRIKFDYRLLLYISIVTLIFSYAGASVVSYLNSEQLKPVILLILIVMAIYTFIKKDLGQLKSNELSEKQKLLYGLLLGAFVGFYDGFFGPGAYGLLLNLVGRRLLMHIRQVLPSCPRKRIQIWQNLHVAKLADSLEI